MRAHLAGIKALLAERYDVAVHLIDVVGSPTYPYLLLWASPGLLRADEADGVQDDLHELLGVTYVAETAEAAFVVASRGRDALLGRRPSVAGRWVQPLRLEDSRDVQPDRDVVLPATNRHPYYGVDLFRLISEPA